MHAKLVLTFALLVFVGVSVAYLVVQEVAPSPIAPSGSERTESSFPGGEDSGEAVLTAYYFHRTQRCRTCRAIEAYAREALEDGLSEAFTKGTLVWKTINLDEPVHEHYAEDFELTSSSLVLVNRVDGEQKAWKNLEEVWDLVGDEVKFKAYVEAQSMLLMEAGP